MGSHHSKAIRTLISYCFIVQDLASKKVYEIALGFRNLRFETLLRIFHVMDLEMNLLDSLQWFGKGHDLIAQPGHGLYSTS